MIGKDKVMDKTNEKEYELSTILAHLRLIADIISPYSGNMDIKAEDLAYVLTDLSNRLEKLE